MQKYNLILLLLFSITTPQLFAQVAQRQVLGASGQSVAVSGLQLDYTLGEAIIGTGSSAGLQVTQGFHQPSESGTFISERDYPQLDIQVYPNPVTDVLHLRISATELRSLQVQLSDVQGRRLLSQTFEPGGRPVFTTTFSLAHLAQGTYFLSISDPEGMILQGYKVVKN